MARARVELGIMQTPSIRRRHVMLMHRDAALNLGCLILPSKFVSETWGTIQFSPENWPENYPKKCLEPFQCLNSYFLNF